MILVGRVRFARVGNGQSQMHQFKVAFNIDESEGAQEFPECATFWRYFVIGTVIVGIAYLIFGLFFA